MISYVLPLRSSVPRRDLSDYLAWLSARADVTVVDGSPPEVFATHAAWWGAAVRHVPVDPARRTAMGKVGGVLTGLDHARHDRVIIADDDVRYTDEALARMAELLDDAEVVRPQNVFSEWPWHAWWDTGRTLLARLVGGDWPGTLGVRRATLVRSGGYAGDVLFENLELVRTVQALGGREVVALDLVVPRVPPSSRHFVSQRVRQAYDELARPARLAVSLSIAPLVALFGRRALVPIVGFALVGAELGRRREGGRAHYPAAAVFAAPFWVAERAVTSWLAVASRILCGGVRYGDARLVRAATSRRVLRERFELVTCTTLQKLS